MKVWDMHCDTLAELRYAQQAGKPKSFLHNDLMMDLERMKQGDYLLQCMACFVHLEPEREKSPLLACLEEIDIFYRLLEQYPDEGAHCGGHPDATHLWQARHDADR